MLSRSLRRFPGGGDQGQQCCSCSIKWLCRFQCKTEPITYGRKARCRVACSNTEAALMGFNREGFHRWSLVVQLHRSQGMPRLASVTVSNTSQPVSVPHLVQRIVHIGFTLPFADSWLLSPASLTCMSTRGLVRMGRVSGNRSGGTIF